MAQVERKEKKAATTKIMPERNLATRKANKN